MPDRRDRLQCGFGLLGVCCLECTLGPCRIDPFGKGEAQGECGRLLDIIVMKNLLTRLATGTAVSGNYARQFALGLLTLSRSGSSLTSKEVKRVAEKLGIERGDRLERIGRKAAEDFSRQKSAPLNWLKPSLTKERFELLSRLKALPYNIDASVMEALGAGGGVDELFMAAVKCSLANFNTLHMIADLARVSSTASLPGWCPAQEQRAEEAEVKGSVRSGGRGGRGVGRTGFEGRLRDLVGRGILDGKVLGIALFVGCGGLGQRGLSLAQEFAKSNILSLFAGCLLEARPGADMSSVGESLRSVLTRIGKSFELERRPPAILNLGSCPEVLKVIELARELASGLGVDTSAIPLMAILTERVDERVEIMAHWMIAVGIPVYWVRIPPLLGSSRVTELYSQMAKTLLGGYAMWDRRPEELVEVLRDRSHAMRLG